MPVFRHRIRTRLRRSPAEPGDRAGEEYVEIDPAELTGIFAAPNWLRDLGIASWLLVGVAAALAGAVWLLALTQTIVVDWIERRGAPRAVGTVVVFLTLVILGVAVAVMILNGVANESGSIADQLQGAADRISGWLQDAGVDAASAESAKADVSGSLSSAFHALLTGVAAGLSRLAGLAVFLSFTALSLFFLLKDAPVISRFVRRHMGVPEPVAEAITGRTARSLQGYFLGMTIVSLFSATIVGVGAIVLGVGLPGTIFAVTFLGGYVPYLGAWAAGFFAILIALGSAGPEAAAAMAVIALLANGAAARPAGRLWHGARHPPACGPDRHDRRRQHVRHDRADPRRAADLGRRSHLGGPGSGSQRRGAGRRG
jgi:predicted PurR-regulated permease PerM